MKFIIEREKLLEPLQQVSRPINSRPKLPILSNLLLQVSENTLLLTSTDLEIEMITKVMLTQPNENGSITVHAHKFYDICRGLPNGAEIKIVVKDKNLFIYSNRSRFLLSTLPATDFPNLNTWQSKIELKLPQKTLKYLIEATQFSMAHQDARYYLNGMLFETKGKKLYTVATDGHRLAICSLNTDKNLLTYSVIVPRKSIIEFMRLLCNSNKLIKLQIGNNNIRACLNNLTFTSKLIDGCFPNYRYVLPKNPDKKLIADCDKLKQAFLRAAILSNDKCRSVHLYITNNQLKITTTNLEQKEESEETIYVDYLGPTLKISFNVNYIIDVLNTLKCKQVNLLFTDSNSGVQIEDVINKNATYIIMPMRL